jgi:NhaA family Na+:H+ antiporter
MILTRLFNEFTGSEKSAGVLLFFCAVVSLLFANVFFGEPYVHIWHAKIFSRPLEFWINDGLMTVFFLLVGLEMEREVYRGELSDSKKALLPLIAALGGMLVPAAIHFSFNNNTEWQKGFGIPMATDIAFSLAILSLLGKRVPASLKIFLTALAIIDDLGAIIVIAIFYSNELSLIWLGFAALVFSVILVLNRLRVYLLWVYLLLGAILWFCVVHSGVHGTISGVLLAFAIPFGSGDEKSISHVLQHRLHKPVAYFILPLFALANTAIIISSSVFNDLSTSNSLGIILGLLAGKPLGIFLFSALGIFLGICTLPMGVRKKHLFGTGLVAGIGFTMSIFISLLAFEDKATIDSSKISVLIGSLLSGIIGYWWLKITLARKHKT